jgi:hypothetical protein
VQTIKHSLFFNGGEGPRSRRYGRTAALRLLGQPYDDDDDDDDDDDYFFVLFLVMEHRWNKIDRGKPKYSGKKPVPVPFRPPQIPHGLTWDRNRASANLAFTAGISHCSTRNSALYAAECVYIFRTVP